MNKEELLAEYANGRRDFSGLDLHGIDLSHTELMRINLIKNDYEE